LDAVDGNAHVSEDKKLVGKTFFHTAHVSRGALKVGDAVEASIDSDARTATEAHHTSTHLLQAALQEALGSRVHQAGSRVDPRGLRFDFTHFEGIPAERLQDIERAANDYVRADYLVDISSMGLDEARAAGAMALFGEKYEDTVRVVRVGDVSMELCGGCHVQKTGVIGFIKILSESSVASGVRRIEAVCGGPGIEVMQSRDRQLTRSAQMLGTGPDDLENRLTALLDENKRLEREVKKWKQAAASGGSVDYMAQVQEVGGVKVLATEVEGQDADGLRMVLDNLRDKLGSGVIVLGSCGDDKVSLCVGVTKDLTGRIKAGDIVKRIAPIVGGGGGGRPDMAQAGGKLPEKLPEAIAQAVEIVAGLLG
jgi:alanyl-tRNA synthetase